MGLGTLTGPPVVAMDKADVLKGQDILCFSHDWGGDPLARNHLMRLLAKDNRILWVNSIGFRAPKASKADLSRAFKKLAAYMQPIRQAERNIFLLNPLAIPAYGVSAVRTFNRLWLKFQLKRAMRHLGFQRPITWVANPAAAVVAGALNEEQVIYNCVDENTAFAGVSASLGELENQLLRRADLVIVTSERLYQSKVKVNPRTVLVRHGVDFNHFRRALDPETPVAEEIAHLPRPHIGFLGLVADWVDVELMAHVAKRFAGGALIVVGRIATDVSVLKQLPNVHFLGRKPYQDLPTYCKDFDVALMPFRMNELTLNSNPLKVREYLAAGLPVVSTPIPEVEVLGHCRIAGDPDGFVREVGQALQDPGPKAQRSEAIRPESWEARLELIRSHLAGLPAKGHHGS